MKKIKSFVLFALFACCGQFLWAQSNIYTQVLTCWETDTINVAALLGITPCASPSVVITSGSTTHLGATATGSNSDSNIVYAYANVAGKPVLGSDTVAFTLTCGGTNHVGVLIITVVACPDNVSFLECVTTPEVFPFSIKQDWASKESEVNLYQPPLIGDLDGDGIPDIVVAKHIDGGFYFPSCREFKNLYVYKGNNRNNPVEITTVSGNYHQTGAYALARVPIAPGVTVALIVMHGQDGYLYSYTLPGVTNPWPGGKSSHTITASYNQVSDRGGVAFADFDNCGTPEIYIGNRIFDAATGKLLVDGELYGTNKGETFAVSNTTYLFHPTAVDIDGDGKLEYIAGNRIYKVNIANRSGSNPHLDPQNNMQLWVESDPIVVAGKTVTDGVTAVADFTGNGQLDVLVATIIEDQVVAIAVWDIQSKKVLGSITNPTNEYTFGIPFIGDIDSDGKLEILMTTRPSMASLAPGDLNGFRLESSGPSSYTLAKRYFQQYKDGSGSTGITLFDFNQSGKARLVYRDEDTLRIMVAVPATAPNLGTFLTEAAFQAGSGTRYEYPVVADVDNDGAAEIIVTGCKGDGNGVNKGTLRIYRSANEYNWAPARKVWNQYNYNVVNVNEDLTIPKYQMNPAKQFPSGIQPFNNFLQQQTLISAEGNPYRLVANIIWEKPDPTMTYAGDSLVFKGCIKNIGEVALQKPFYISYYKNDTIVPNLIDTVSINYTIMKDSTLCFRIAHKDISKIPNIGGMTSIWISINDKGTGKYPFQAQCDAQGRWEFTLPTKEVETNVITCWDTDTINVASLLGITPCASPNVSITSGSTTKLGATVSNYNNNIVYASANVAGKPVLGSDTVNFTLTCSGILQNGILVIKVLQCPDNVNNVKCDKPVTGFQWDIMEDWKSVETNISTYVTPLAGDLKGEGNSVQIVAAARNGSSGGSNAIYIYEGENLTLPPTKISTIEFENAVGVLAMARVQRPAPYNDTIPIIVVRGNDNFLYAYNPYKPGYLEWKSSAVAQIPANASSNRQGSVIFFADFDNCGTPEICCGNSIFNSVDGILLTQGPPGGNKGDYTVGPGVGSARLSMPAVGDIDGDGKLEYVAGTQIYKVNITNRAGSSGNSMPLLTDIGTISFGGANTIKDGYTVLADFNGDEQLEVLVASRISGGSYGLAIWDPRTKQVLARSALETLRNNPSPPGLGFPFIGDVDGDGELEILCTTTHNDGDKNYVNGYRWRKGSTVLDRVYRTIFFDGSSGCTGITLFDFNQSGKANLVYRDERDLRIIQAVPGAPGVEGTFQTLKMYSATSGTGWEMPVIADINNDGAAEIVVSGDAPSGAGSAHYGTLRVYKSGNEYNWAPARKVWNQVPYNVININEDLTVPQFQMNTAKIFPNGKQPFNNFLQQQTRINQEGNNYALFANLVWEKPDPSMTYAGDSLVFEGCIKNIGEVALQKPFYIAYYKNDTIVPNLIHTVTINQTIMKDSTFCFRLVLKDISQISNSAGMASIWISFNDKGTGKYPFQAECDAQGRWEFDFCTSSPFITLSKNNDAVCAKEEYALTGNIFGGALVKNVSVNTTNGAGTPSHFSEMSPTDSVFTIRYIPAPADIGKIIEIVITAQEICGKTTDTLYLTVKPLPTVTMRSYLACFDDEVDLESSILSQTPGASIHYFDSEMKLISPKIAGKLAPGNYTYFVQPEFAGCFGEIVPVNIKVNDRFVITSAYPVNHPSCTNNTLGSIQIYVSGGSGNYNYNLNGGAWETLAPNGIIDNLVAGSYFIGIQDAEFNCPELLSGEIILANTPGELTLEVEEITDATVCFDTDDGGGGAFTLNVLHGSGAGTYKVNGIGDYPYFAALPDIPVITETDLLPGNYLIEIHDANGCYAGINVRINSSASTLAISEIDKFNVTNCLAADGEASFYVTHFDGSVYYQLNNGPVVDITTHLPAKVYLMELGAGEHRLRIFDGCGEIDSTFVIGNFVSDIEFTATTTPESLSCDSIMQPGKIKIEITPGVAPFSYRIDGKDNWIELSGTDTTFNAMAGLYTIEVMDDAGCVFTLTRVRVERTDEMIDKCKFTLDLTVYLQGVTQPSGLMSNYLQDKTYSPLPNAKLPEDDPYKPNGVVTTYPEILNFNGPAGLVTDWILVEIWGDFTPGIYPITYYQLFESRALLLQPDGKVVDIAGNKPKFDFVYGTDIRVVVKHRNHLAVISSKLFSGTKDIIYNFSTATTQAISALMTLQLPQVNAYGKYSMWAGEYNNNNILDAVDATFLLIQIREENHNEYNAGDVNMDGLVDGDDELFIKHNTKIGLYGPLRYFIKK